MIQVVSNCISLRLYFERFRIFYIFPTCSPQIPVSPQKKVTSLIIASVAITSLVTMLLVSAAHHGMVINRRSGWWSFYTTTLVIKPRAESACVRKIKLSLLYVVSCLAAAWWLIALYLWRRADGLGNLSELTAVSYSSSLRW